MVATGKGKISNMVVLAIWTISLVVNLPGLAVTPMLNSLDKIFGNVTELEVQLLTMLPNVVIIPFVLMSGKLSMSRHKIVIIVTSLIIYVAAGVFYFFAKNMTHLILISCLLGCGCGLLIPFSTGLVADVFVGRYRMMQMGIISGIGNFALVAATLIVGWLAVYNWHLPFLVYLLPLIPLALTPFLKQIPSSDLYHTPLTTPDQKVVDETPKVQPDLKLDSKGNPLVAHRGFYVGRIVAVTLSYFFFIYISVVPSYYLPFLFAGKSTTFIGLMTCVFYLAMFFAGVGLSYYLSKVRQWAFVVAMGMIVTGFVIFVCTRDVLLASIAYFMIGFGNGTAQPIFYDKAPETVATPRRSTFALAIVLAANYAAISLVPIVVELFESIFGCHTPLFPFILNLGFAVVMLAVIIWKRNSFAFKITDQYF